MARKNKDRRTKPTWQKDIARERIEILFEEAEKAFAKHPERSDRYVELARRIGMKYLVPIPTSLKKRFCKKCHRYLQPGKNCRIRLNSKNKTKTVTCLNCNSVSRQPYSRRGKGKPF